MKFKSGSTSNLTLIGSKYKCHILVLTLYIQTNKMMSLIFNCITPDSVSLTLLACQLLCPVHYKEHSVMLAIVG